MIPLHFTLSGKLRPGGAAAFERALRGHFPEGRMLGGEVIYPDTARLVRLYGMFRDVAVTVGDGAFTIAGVYDSDVRLTDAPLWPAVAHMLRLKLGGIARDAAQDAVRRGAPKGSRVVSGTPRVDVAKENDGGARAKPLTPTQWKALAYVAAYGPTPRDVHTDYWGSHSGSEGIRHDTLAVLQLAGLITTSTRKRYRPGAKGGTYWTASTSATVTPAGLALLATRAPAAKPNGAPAPTKSPSVWIALHPPAREREALAGSGTVPSDKVHATLAYLGRLDALPPDVEARALRAMRAVARRVAPIVAHADGLRRFPGARSQTVYVALASRDLAVLRAALAERLTREGVGPDPAHYFVPHLTVGMADADAVWPHPTPPRMPVHLRAMTLWVGKRRVVVPLAGAARA